MNREIQSQIRKVVQSGHMGKYFGANGTKIRNMFLLDDHFDHRGKIKVRIEFEDNTEINIDFGLTFL